MLVRILNGIFYLIGSLLQGLLNLLPNTPFNVDINIPHWARVVGYVVPWQEMLMVFTAYLSAVGVYMVVRVLLRWVKAVGQ